MASNNNNNSRHGGFQPSQRGRGQGGRGRGRGRGGIYPQGADRSNGQQANFNTNTDFPGLGSNVVQSANAPSNFSLPTQPGTVAGPLAVAPQAQNDPSNRGSKFSAWRRGKSNNGGSDRSGNNGRNSGVPRGMNQGGSDFDNVLYQIQNKMNFIKTSRPLTTFHKFSELPAEIRVQIWTEVMSWPHIIEIEYGPIVRNNENMLDTNCFGKHTIRRVCPNSRKPPAILHVNQEARGEALKVYQLRTLDTRSPGHAEKEIYFNPKVDIVYLGEEACRSTLLCIDMDVQRLAMRSSGRFTQCCDNDNETYGIVGSISPMQGLHGFYRIEAARGSRAIREAEARATGRPLELVRDDQWNFNTKAIAENPYSNDDIFPGLPGLRDVFMVVQSNLCKPEPGQVGLEHTFRPATTNGLTNGQHRYKAHIQRDIDRVMNDTALEGVGKNKWLGDNKPAFHWVSLSDAPAVEGRQYQDGLGVDEKAYGFMRWGEEYYKKGIKCEKREEWSNRRRVQNANGCSTFPGENPREIGFKGSKKAVAAAKKMVIEMLESIGEHIITVYGADP
ncbi:hypothetical protein HYALB_00003845 [Hymenoscyphus albidus]|uniref:2EXR domain-containing protein n=1 Tax=Hymenoscyphus albidus TaxID=595503 RepID=A0A9N9LZG1_9HELO|nr:hypothetical protein HYALB_00003845 [Hymenoscyphus albidus]